MNAAHLHRISQILREMKDLTNSGHPESAHEDADDLLVELVGIVGADDPVVPEIIEAYGDVPKWYA